MQVLPNAPYNAAKTSTRDAHKLWDPTNIFSKQNHVADSPMTFAGELGDGVSMPLPHGILGTSGHTQVGRSFKVRTGVCLNFFLFVQVWGPGESCFFRNVPAQPS